jgi:branched-chain amino acid transport system ATP-binding protein
MTENLSAPTGIVESAKALPYEERPVLLEAHSVQVTYNRVAVAIAGVTLKVPEASIVAVLGSNGAGKTTTLRALTGFLPGENGAVTAGRFLFQGQELKRRFPHQIARDGIVLVPERNKVFATLTVDENLAAVVTRSGGNRQRMHDLAFEVFPPLAGLRTRRGGYLSGGERQMLAIAKALVADPILLLVDELSLGIAPVLVIRLMRSLTTIRDAMGISILLVEQNAAAALQIADHAYVMETGRIVLEGSPAELQSNRDVQQYYLGQGAEGENRKYGATPRHRRSWGG